MEALKDGAETQHVIITLKPGYRPRSASALSDQGDTVIGIRIDRCSLPKFSVLMPGELAAQDEVESLALDSRILRTAPGSRRHDQPG